MFVILIIRELAVKGVAAVTVYDWRWSEIRCLF